MMHRLHLASALALAVGLSSCAPSEPGWVDEAVVAEQLSDGTEWVLSGRTFADDRFSPLKQINDKTVSRLGFAWDFDEFIVRGNTHHAMESNPIFVDGVLYFSGPWGNAYAVDARTGKKIWDYDSEADGQFARNACCDVVNRGLTVWKGKVYVASLDGFLIALNAKTGEVEWRVDTLADRSKSYSITGGTHIAGGNILIGNSGAEFGVRGYVTAYDLETGKQAWRFWSVPGDPAKGPDETPDVSLARKTWSANTRWDLGGGGTAWDDMTYDPELNLVYLGLGNGGPYPSWVRSPGGGDNLFLSSIVAVDADTGRMKWFYQTTPADSWDFTATQHMILADLKIDGRDRKVIMQAPKNGFFYVLDRVTGELLKADPYATVNWASSVDLRTGRPVLTDAADYSKEPKIIWPHVGGAHGWPPMSFSPQTGLVYIPVFDAATKLEPDVLNQPVTGQLNYGARPGFPPFNTPSDIAQLKGQPEPGFAGILKAWDPTRGKVVWQASRPFLNGGTLATAGNLVFQGSVDGKLVVYDARNGRVLKAIDTGTAILAAPITYELDGVQYVAVIGGSGGTIAQFRDPKNAISNYRNYERLMVFKLDGGETPRPPARIEPPQQPTPAAIRATAAQLQRGQQLFMLNCVRCHAPGGTVGGFPNLWNISPTALNAFQAIVYDGALQYGGMPSFSDTLSVDDVNAIKAYLVDDIRKRRRQGMGSHDAPITVPH